jgi:SpoVK/Ycf46/Vps4 family AAA+-type ATPase
VAREGERSVGLELTAVPPSRLPNFASVGELDALKAEIGDAFGLVLAHAHEADAYRIHRNRLLLFGPPGVGMSFFARAVAGELELNFILVATADLVSPHTGEGPHLAEQVFVFATSHEPASLFFDEFDAVAGSRTEIEGGTRRVTCSSNCCSPSRPAATRPGNRRFFGGRSQGAVPSGRGGSSAAVTADDMAKALQTEATAVTDHSSVPTSIERHRHRADGH